MLLSEGPRVSGPKLEGASKSQHHVNLQDRSGKTILIHSSAKGNVTIVEELARDENVDVNIADTEGNTALIHAAVAGHHRVVQTLIDRFPHLQIDKVNKLGQSALIKAAIQGRVSCCRILLKAGADPYLRDRSRQFCPLQWAEFVGRTECASTIANFMLEPCKQPQQKLPTANDSFKQVTCVVTAPVCATAALSASNELFAGNHRPRLRSAPPIPTVKITPSEGKFMPYSKRICRPSSSCA